MSVEVGRLNKKQKKLRKIRLKKKELDGEFEELKEKKRNKWKIVKF